jgi:Thiamine pyrophosphate enzyme, N-terminal TPP binding domain
MSTKARAIVRIRRSNTLNKHDLVRPANSAAVLRSGGEILVAGLRLNGADRMFGVPGESALPIFDALVGAGPGIRFIACRHEATASHMAEADGKISGSPGICVVSRGPGAMHAAIGLHTAWQDSTPMIMIIGQVPRRHRGREAFQEINYTRTFDDMTKWVGEVESPDQIPEFVSRAFHIAMQGRPGPVVLSLPEDVLSAMSDVANASPAQIAETGPSDAQMFATRRAAAPGAAPDDHRRQSRLDASCSRTVQRVRRAQRHPGYRWLPFAGCVGQQKPSVCRRPQPRLQPCADGARQGRRPAPGDRRSAW